MRPLAPSRARLAATATATVAGIAALLLSAAPAVAATPAASVATDTTATAAATALAASATVDACTITSASLVWGFKESFRSYISGSIAKGQWETIDGASYETPVFTWNVATGEIAPDAASGAIAFTGGIHFSGHSGLLDSTVSNPTLVIDSAGHAQVLLDISGVSMENALAGVTTPDVLTQIAFVDVDLAAATTATTDGVLTLAVTDAPTAITQAGYDAFGNYETGSAFDPISIQLTADCPVEAEPAPETPAVDESADVDAAAPEADDAEGPALWPFVAGGIALVVAAAAAVLLTRRRANRADAMQDPSAPEDHPGAAQ